MLMRKHAFIAFILVKNTFASEVLEGFFPIKIDATSTDFMNVGGGKCADGSNGGRSYDQVIVARNFVDLGLATQEEVDGSGPVDKIRACAKLCELEGDDCEGFSFHKDRGQYRTADVYFHKNFPTYTLITTSRNYYNDYLCFAKEQTQDEPLCDKLSNVRTVCLSSPMVCEAQANLKKNGKESCDSWCGRSSLVCDQAWNDKNSCGKKRTIPCSTTGKNYSICSCKKS